MIFRIFGYIPSPIIFGNVIDSTCMYWKAHCGRQGGSCLIYNIEHFRLRYIGVCSALKVAAGLLFFLDWILVCYTSSQESSTSSKHLSRRKRASSRVCNLVSRTRRCLQLRQDPVPPMIGLNAVPVGEEAVQDEQEQQEVDFMEPGLDSDYNSAVDVEVIEEH